MTNSQVPPLIVLIEFLRDLPALIIIFIAIVYSCAYLHSFIRERAYLKKYLPENALGEWREYFFSKNINATSFAYSLFLAIEILILILIGYHSISIFSIQYNPTKEVYPVIKELVLIFAALAFFPAWALTISVRNFGLSSRIFFRFIHKKFVSLFFLFLQAIYLVATCMFIGFLLKYFPLLGDSWLYLGACIIAMGGSVITHAVLILPAPRCVKWADRQRLEGWYLSLVIAENKSEFWVKNLDSDNLILLPKAETLIQTIDIKTELEPHLQAHLEFPQSLKHSGE